MTTLYITRHGNTLFNKTARMQGWSDSPLLEDGILQAKALHESLKTIPFEAMYSSTSGRAIDTLAYIRQDLDIPVYQEERLREYYFGDIEGELVSNLTTTRKNWDFFYPGWEHVGGETVAILQERTFAALEEIASRHTGDVLIVSHGATILGIIDRFLPEVVHHYMEEGLRIKNCSMTVLQYENGEFTLEFYNDTSYVEKGLKIIEDKKSN